MFGKGSFLLLLIGIVLCSCGGEERSSQMSVVEKTNLTNLEKKVADHPDSLLLVHELIETYRNEGKYEQAISLTRENIEKDAGNAYLWNILAALHFENADTARAIQALEEAIAIYPLPDYLSALGKIYAQLQDERSLEIADELIATGQDRYVKNGYFIKGFFFNYQHYPQITIAYMDSAINLDHTFMYAYREKAIALYELQNYKRALAVLKRAVTLQNNFDEGYYWMGRNYEALKDTASAIASYERALLYDKNYLEAREALEQLNQK